MSHFSKQINFIGSNKHELLLFLSNVINLLELRCVVIDASSEQNLKYVIPVVIQEEIITYRGVDYIININSLEKYQMLSLDVYDVVIIDFGLNTEFLSVINESELLFFVSDFMKYNVEKLRFMLESISPEMELIKIYKDVVYSKISSKFIDRKLKLKNRNIKGQFIFDLDEESYNYNLNIQYDDILNFKYLKKEYALFLEDVISEVFDYKDCKIKKIIKFAKRRKKDASSVLEYSTWAISNYN